MKRQYEIDTDKCTEIEEMLRFLMMEDVVFINNGHWIKGWPKDHITTHVNCNDVFAWGCADAENILASDIEDLFNHAVKDEHWGAAIWCIKKRKQKPQPQVYEHIKGGGVWPIDEIIREFK